MGKSYKLTGLGTRSPRHISEAQKSWLRWEKGLRVAERELGEKRAKELRYVSERGGLCGYDRITNEKVIDTSLVQLRRSVGVTRALAQHALRQER
jgi:hypothetical protein